MEITDIKIRKLFEEGPMKAVVSVTFDNQLAVHDVKIINARDKFFIVMPSRKNPDGTYRDIVHPINAAFRAELESAVLKEYEAELERVREAAESAPADGVSRPISARLRRPSLYATDGFCVVTYYLRKSGRNSSLTAPVTYP